MKRSHWFALLLALAFLIGLLGSAAAYGEKVPITMWFQWQPPQVQEWLKEWEAEFNAGNPDIDLTIQTEVSDPRGKLVVQSAAGVPPDIMYEVNTVMGRWAATGLAAPLDQFLKKGTMKSDVLPEVINSVTFNGHVYAIPFSMWPWFDIANMDIFAEAGMTSYPQSWAELITTARKLTKVNNDGSRERFGWTMNRSSYLLYGALNTAMIQLGEPIIKAGDVTADLNNQRGRRAMQYLRDLFEAGGNSLAGSAADILQGNVAAVGYYNGTIGIIKDIYANDHGGKYSFNRFPGPEPGQDAVVYMASAFMVPSASKHQAEAWRVLEAFTSKATVKKYLMTHGGTQTVLRSLMGDNDLLSRPYAKEQVALLYPPILDHGTPHYYYDEFRYPVGDEVGRVINGQVPIEEALIHAEQAVNQLIAEKLAQK